MNCVVLVFTIFTFITLVNTLPINQTYESPTTTTTATPTSTTLEVLNHGVGEAKTTKVIPLQVPLDSYTGSVSDSGNIITRSGLFGLRETPTFPSSFSRPLSYLDSENIIGRTALVESRFTPISHPGQPLSPEYDDEDSDENETTQSSDKKPLTDSSGTPAYSNSKKIMTKGKHQNLRMRPTNHSRKNITLGNIDDDSQGKKVIESSLEKPPTTTVSPLKRISTSQVSEKLRNPTPTPSQMSKVLSPLSPTSTSVPPLKLNSTSLVSEKLGNPTPTPSQMSKVLPSLSPRSTTVPPLPSEIFMGTLGNCNPLIAVSLKHGLRTMGVIFISIKNSISVSGLPLLVL